MYRLIVVLLAAAAAIATAIFVPLLYVQEVEHLQLLRLIPVEIARWAPVGLIGYVLFSVLSWAAGQGGSTRLYWLDYISSGIAWLSINASAIFVGVGLYNSYPGVVRILDLPWAFFVLWGLVAFSWIDIWFLQGDKYEPAKQWIAAAHATTPPPPPPPVYPAHPTQQPAAQAATTGGRTLALKDMVIGGAALLVAAWLIFGAPDIFGFNYNSGRKLGPDKVTIDDRPVKLPPARPSRGRQSRAEGGRLDDKTDLIISRSPCRLGDGSPGVIVKVISTGETRCGLNE